LKISELIDEQQADETLSGAHSFAKQNKGGYFLKNGVLFHRMKILDNFVEHLVVPKGRRQALLEHGACVFAQPLASRWNAECQRRYCVFGQPPT